VQLRKLRKPSGRRSANGRLTTRHAQRVISRRYGLGWGDLQSHLELGPGVREVIETVRKADLDSLQTLVREHPRACNPYWPGRDGPPKPIPLQSIPLFAVCSCARENTRGNTADLAQALLDAGADPNIRNSYPLTSAASFSRPDVTDALLDAGAVIDGVNDDGSPGAHSSTPCNSAPTSPPSWPSMVPVLTCERRPGSGTLMRWGHSSTPTVR